MAKKKNNEKPTIKPISFGSGDKLILEYFLSQTNSSAYVRGLIERDMREKNLPVSEFEINMSRNIESNTQKKEETIKEEKTKEEKVKSEIDEKTKETFSRIGR